MMQEAKPANAMVELRKETREFLAKLEPSDIKTLDEGIQFMRRVETFGFVLKWLAITTVAIVAGIVTFGESIMKIFGWFKH